MIVFSSKYVSGREKCAEESKILCGCLARGSPFCGMLHLAPQNHGTIIKQAIMLTGKNMAILLLKGKTSKSSEASSNTKNIDDNQQTLEDTLSRKILFGREWSTFSLQYCINF